MLLKILVSTYKRDIPLQRLIFSIDKYTNNKKNVKVIIFNNNDYKIKGLKYSKKLNVEIVDTKKNTGKTFNTLNYVANDKDENVFYLYLDDKLEFIKPIDYILDVLALNKFNFYTLCSKYVNHPINLKTSRYFNEGLSMNDYYQKSKDPLSQSSDRTWIFSQQIVNSKIKKIKKFLKLSFLQNEISICGTNINWIFYREKCGIIKNDIPFIKWEYSINGCSWNNKNNEWIFLHCPNSALYELWQFVFFGKHLKQFLIFIYNFCSSYRYLNKQNRIDRKIFRKKFIVLLPLYTLIYWLKKLNRW